MKITNRLNLPDAIVRAVAADDYTRGKAHISVTGLISSPRMSALRELHEDELVEDASDRIWSLFGKVAHGILEVAGDDAKSLVEERLYTEENGWVVSGAFDRLALLADSDDTWLLQDYKTCSVWSVILGEKPEWVRQANLYALLLRRHSFPVGRAQIVAILRDWQRSKAEQRADYPQAPVAVVDVPLWSVEEQEQYLTERVRLHQAARAGGILPDCTAEERWERPTQYALMKAGNKRASRVYDNEEEAAAAVKPGYAVEVRLGASVRCQKAYCSAFPFCDQASNGTLTLEADSGGEGG